MALHLFGLLCISFIQWDHNFFLGVASFFYNTSVYIFLKKCIYVETSRVKDIDGITITCAKSKLRALSSFTCVYLYFYLIISLYRCFFIIRKSIIKMYFFGVSKSPWKELAKHFIYTLMWICVSEKLPTLRTLFLNAKCKQKRSIRPQC